MCCNNRVFIIEDDSLMQILLSTQLKKSGYNVIGVASSGKNGLEQIETISPDVVFVDIGLPDINGVDLIREMQQRKPVAVVVVSSEYRLDVVKAASEAGALAYIVKPPEINEIERAIIIATAQFDHQMEMKKLNSLLVNSIEEKKKAEEQLSESEKKFRALAENTSDMIIRNDTQYRFVYVNPAFEKDLNIPSETIIGKTLEQMISDKDKRLYCESLFKKVIETKKNAQFEISFSNPRRIYDWSMVPEYDEQNTIKSVLSTVRNITELRDAQDRLYQLEKMQAIGQLASGIAHDFNNKLGAILGYADILLDTLSDDDHRRKYVDSIIKASQFVSDLTSQLLAYARKGKVKNVLTDMHSIIGDLVRFLESSFDKKIIISKKFKAEIPFIFGDPVLLKNAFLNVAINANDAMPEGGSLTFETDNVTIGNDDSASVNGLSAGKYLQIRIVDTGTGIDNKILKRIFEPFFTTKDIGKGTGLGLPAVYGIVKSHFGSISVSSELGKGATFDLYFPLASPDGMFSVKDITIDSRNGWKTILIVDDNELIREMAAEMLNKMGYNVVLCSNGNDAIKMYNVYSDKIDLVWIDIMMPGIDGYETYMQLKTINPGVKAFLISGYSINEKASRFLDEGVLGIIQKPFHKSEVQLNLSKVFEEKGNPISA